MSSLPHEGADDRNVTPDAASQDAVTPETATPDMVGPDWEWRRRVRAHPQFLLIYRIVVGVVGLMVLALGLVLVPFPGPGWLVVLLGLAILASEFTWAQRLLRIARETLQRWNDLLRPQPWWVKGIVLLLTVFVVMVIIWLLFVTSGVPGFFPDFAKEWLSRIPGL